MKGPEAYKAGYAESLKSKLFIPRTREGSPQEEVFEVVRLLQRELGSQKGLIGVAPVGSSLFGYGSEKGKRNPDTKEPSDVDVAIFYDSQVQPGVVEKLEKIVYGETKMRAHVQPESSEVHVSRVFVFDIRLDDIDRFAAAVKKNELVLSGKQFEHVFEMLSMFSWIAVGPKVDTYREHIGQMINGLKKSARDTVVSEIARWSYMKERGGITEGAYKRTTRMLSDLSEHELRELRAVRDDMWKKRIRTIYQIKA